MNESATSNIAKLVGSQKGEVIVSMYDWHTYFTNKTVKTALKGITQMHHFQFSSEHPGKVVVQESTTDGKRTISLLKDPSWRPSDLPQQLSPPGLSFERQYYLNDKIWEFCPEYCQDAVCPKPHQPRL